MLPKNLCVTLLGLGLLLCSYSFSPVVSAGGLFALTDRLHLKVYQEFLNGRNPIDIRSFKTEEHRLDRFVIEMILLQQALHLGGFKNTIEFFPVTNNYNMAISHLKNGKIAVTGECLLSEILSPHSEYVELTEAVIEEGEYEVGLYTSATNDRVLTTDVSEIPSLTAISSKNWATDWRVLEKLQLKKLEHTGSWRYMYKAVDEQKVDFTLLPFRADDLNYQFYGVDLLPIPGVKLTLDDSCHFAVSKNIPESLQLLTSINRGLIQLRKMGRINRAYSDISFFHPAVKSWVSINTY